MFQFNTWNQWLIVLLTINQTIACSVNLVVNGDGETGPCENSNSVTHPTGWSYYGLITQIAYSNIQYGSLYSLSPGPSDRGQCYFVGNDDPGPSMYQMVNLETFASMIDSGTAMFNLSAWLGGWTTQDDNAKISIYFQNSRLQIIGSLTILGPVLAADRNDITSSVFRNKTGLIPAYSRWVVVMVNITRVYTGGPWNDGSVDNLRFEIPCDLVTTTVVTTKQDTTSDALITPTTKTTIQVTTSGDLIEKTTGTTIQDTTLGGLIEKSTGTTKQDTTSGGLVETATVTTKQDTTSDASVTATTETTVQDRTSDDLVETTTVTTKQDTTSGDIIGKTTEAIGHNTTMVQTSINDLQSSIISTFTFPISHSDTSYQTYGLSSLYFIPPICTNTTNIGFRCNISSSPCDMLMPCLNNGTCNNTDISHYGYNCSCSSGFSGTQCQFDHRPCKEDTCWNNGICNETSHRAFVCLCINDWQGIHCEKRINYCQNITCENNGVCRSLFFNYSCECLGTGYYGRYCEIIATRIFIYRSLSKSFGFIAIIIMTSVAMFVVIMDIFKYGFNIDPPRKEFERIQKNKQKTKRRLPVIQKFVYVGAPSMKELGNIVEETAV